ncbi:hypothetical protein DFH06DRAFT_1132154 [Mycena polygramma]|nr:hypothetical protein DFH06DRAFT_1132154 [Mycena polygramma]
MNVDCKSIVAWTILRIQFNRLEVRGIMNLEFDQYGEILAFRSGQRDVNSINSACSTRRKICEETLLLSEIPETPAISEPSELGQSFNRILPKKKIQHDEISAVSLASGKKELSIGDQDTKLISCIRICGGESKLRGFFRQKLNQMVQNQPLGASLEWSNAGLGSCLFVFNSKNNSGIWTRSRDPAISCHAEDVTATSACFGTSQFAAMGQRHSEIRGFLLSVSVELNANPTKTAIYETGATRDIPFVSLSPPSPSWRPEDEFWSLNPAKNLSAIMASRTPVQVRFNHRFGDNFVSGSNRESRGTAIKLAIKLGVRGLFRIRFNKKINLPGRTKSEEEKAELRAPRTIQNVFDGSTGTYEPRQQAPVQFRVGDSDFSVGWDSAIPDSELARIATAPAPTRPHGDDLKPRLSMPRLECARVPGFSRFVSSVERLRMP